MASQPIDEVSKNSIWREHVRKENKIDRPNGDFRINPQKLNPISPNPHNIDPRAIAAQNISAEGTLANFEAIKKFFEEKDCEEKNDRLEQQQIRATLYFQTTNADTMSRTNKASKLRGASDALAMPISQKQWYAGRQKCEVTNYAEAYVRMSSTSPFSNKAQTGGSSK